MSLIPRSACPADTLWTEVDVRVYDATGRSAQERQSALDVAAAIVAATSIQIVWTWCEAIHVEPGHHAGPVPTACQSPIRRRELAVRIVVSPDGTHHSAMLPLGDALLDARARSGVLATVYGDRVAWLAEQTGTDEQVLLGRAIAHELGHLLLATDVHDRTGIMRAVWSRSELLRMRANDWVFQPKDIAAISARALAR